MAYEGEIEVQASSGGRQITLDPLREKMLAVYCKEVESTLPCGLRMLWVEGERDGADFRLATGSGVGNPWIMFEYKGRGYCIDIRDILEELFTFTDEPQMS